MNNYSGAFERYLESLEKQLKEVKAKEGIYEKEDIKLEEDIRDKRTSKDEIDTDVLSQIIQLEEEKEKLKQEKEALQKEVNDLEEQQQTMNFKDRFVRWTIILASCYVIFAAYFSFRSEASDVLKGIIWGSALVTIIRLPKIIIEGLFKKDNKNSSKRYKISIQNHKNIKSD